MPSQAKYRDHLPQLDGGLFLTDGGLGGRSPRLSRRTDDLTGGYAAYFMINCARPRHFRHVLDTPGSWRERIRGIRANASRRSHAELDACTGG